MGNMSLNWLSKENFNTYYNVAEFVDPVTKVHYLVFFASISIAIDIFCIAFCENARNFASTR